MIKFMKQNAAKVAGIVVAILPMASHAAAYTYDVTPPTASGDLVTSILNFVEALPQYAIDMITNNVGIFSLFAFLGLGLYVWHFVRKHISGGRR